jgi:hypothetical protein
MKKYKERQHIVTKKKQAFDFIRATLELKEDETLYDGILRLIKTDVKPVKDFMKIDSTENHEVIELAKKIVEQFIMELRSEI